MKKSDIDKLQSDASRALKSAVKKAIAMHEAAGVPAVIWRDGKVVRLPIRRARRRNLKKK